MYNAKYNTVYKTIIRKFFISSSKNFILCILLHAYIYLSCTRNNLTFITESETPKRVTSIFVHFST